MALRILVIEDEPRWQEQFHDILENMQYDVDVAKGIEDAKVQLEEHTYELVLIDIILDEVHAPGLTQHFIASLRQQYPDLPVMAVTGKELNPEESFKLYKSGIIDFIFKFNMDLSDFRKRVRYALGKFEGIE